MGLAAAQKALAASPSSPQLKAELAYLQAEHGLWASVQDYEDPAIYGALEQYAKRFEVSLIDQILPQAACTAQQ